MNQVLDTHVDSIIVPHPGFQSGLKKLNLITTRSAGLEPNIVPVIGESRAGKSTLLRHYISMYPSSRQSNGVIMPIVSVLTPATPSQIGLAKAILVGLKDPLPHSRQSLNDLTDRLTALIKQCEVKVIILDEIQHFVAQRGIKSVNAAADWLKNLVEETKVLLILSGLPYALEMLFENEQLAGRASSPIYMPKYNWADGDSREEFCAVMSAFGGAMHPFSVPDLGSEEMAFRFYCASDGLIGHVVKILRFASWATLDDDSQIITMDQLELGYDLSMLKRENMSNPFSKRFKFGVNSEKSVLKEPIIETDDVMNAQPKRRGRQSAPASV